MNNNFLDITEESCPYTIVKVKVAISDIEQGEILEILMAEGVPCRNIPKVVEFEGHEILSMTDNKNGTHSLKVKKN